MYEGSRTRDKNLCGVTEYFNIGVSVNQGSALSPYLFSMIIDEVMKVIQGETWCIIFTNDIDLVGENLKSVNNSLNN